jgi:hypothetical protein
MVSHGCVNSRECNAIFCFHQPPTCTLFSQSSFRLWSKQRIDQPAVTTTMTCFRAPSLGLLLGPSRLPAARATGVRPVATRTLLGRRDVSARTTVGLKRPALLLRPGFNTWKQPAVQVRVRVQVRSIGKSPIMIWHCQSRGPVLLKEKVEGQVKTHM